jgi:hypothetical protein
MFKTTKAKQAVTFLPENDTNIETSIKAKYSVVAVKIRTAEQVEFWEGTPLYYHFIDEMVIARAPRWISFKKKNFELIEGGMDIVTYEMEFASFRGQSAIKATFHVEASEINSTYSNWKIAANARALANHRTSSAGDSFDKLDKNLITIFHTRLVTGQLDLIVNENITDLQSELDVLAKMCAKYSGKLSFNETLIETKWSGIIIDRFIASFDEADLSAGHKAGIHVKWATNYENLDFGPRKGLTVQRRESLSIKQNLHHWMDLYDFDEKLVGKRVGVLERNEFILAILNGQVSGRGETNDAMFDRIYTQLLSSEVSKELKKHSKFENEHVDVQVSYGERLYVRTWPIGTEVLDVAFKNLPYTVFEWDDISEYFAANHAAPNWRGEMHIRGLVSKIMYVTFGIEA